MLRLIPRPTKPRVIHLPTTTTTTTTINHLYRKDDHHTVLSYSHSSIIISHQPSTINHRPSTIDHQPSTVLLHEPTPGQHLQPQHHNLALTHTLSLPHLHHHRPTTHSLHRSTIALEQ
ncbi:uncharacterized protein K489DRAFT_210089 [Dissoconium aciculare CBS 342.82]|uniref:Uncharacterized protein n=1 Tax=Dissoconium aciculare CBS 342.82 TaxID=1314786 RepID=A0A6J3MAM1_9PEZI|nr:uncharacterized protein K489DRAFT_210089 [Dissoconium aciculare CBS 342.82]KAF1823872.1 hypothetical protein K489DRAFT_210089 [Dissoconium aciculare CBS 342.82]